jgi:hypothetical protein
MSNNGFDEDNKHKAAIFDVMVLKRSLPEEMNSAYREVRQAIPITAYSGGLWMTECLDLKLEQIIRSREGYTINHTRARQRTDKMSTKYLLPEEVGYAKQLAIYLIKQPAVQVPR